MAYTTTHKTKGIVLRTVKYGETSIVATIFTERFGLQSYMVNGVRSASAKRAPRAVFFQPAVLLEMEVYYNSFKTLNRIKEYQMADLCADIFSNVIKNGVAQYMVELLAKCLKEPEPNADLFAFAEDSLLHLNECNEATMANFPVFFAVQLSGFFGFFPRLQYSASAPTTDLVFDLQEGVFTHRLPEHRLYTSAHAALLLAELTMARQPAELAQIPASGALRTKALEALETYYALHIQDFGKMKTLPVLGELMR